MSKIAMHISKSEVYTIKQRQWHGYQNLDIKYEEFKKDLAKDIKHEEFK